MKRRNYEASDVGLAGALSVADATGVSDDAAGVFSADGFFPELRKSVTYQPVPLS